GSRTRRDPPAQRVYYYDRGRSATSTLARMPQPARHLFVCLNERSPGSRPAWGERGGPATFSALQRAIGHRPELWGQVAVTGCRCLGPCFDGPTVVVYP